MGVASWGLLVLGLMGAPEDDIELSAEEMELLRELQEESGRADSASSSSALPSLACHPSFHLGRAGYC